MVEVAKRPGATEEERQYGLRCAHFLAAAQQLDKVQGFSLEEKAVLLYNYARLHQAAESKRKNTRNYVNIIKKVRTRIERVSLNKKYIHIFSASRIYTPQERKDLGLGEFPYLVRSTAEMPALTQSKFDFLHHFFPVDPNPCFPSNKSSGREFFSHSTTSSATKSFSIINCATRSPCFIL